MYAEIGVKREAETKAERRNVDSKTETEADMKYVCEEQKNSPSGVR